MDNDLRRESTDATSRVLNAVPRDLTGELREARRAVFLAELHSDTAGVARAEARLEELRDHARVYLNYAFQRSFESRTKMLKAAMEEVRAARAEVRAARAEAEEVLLLLV